MMVSNLPMPSNAASCLDALVLAPEAHLIHRKNSRDSCLTRAFPGEKKTQYPLIRRVSEIAKWHGIWLISDQDASNFVYKTEQLT